MLTNEYEFLRPFSIPEESAIARLAVNPQLRTAVEREVDRALAQSENNASAWYLRGRIAGLRGSFASEHPRAQHR